MSFITLKIYFNAILFFVNSETVFYKYIFSFLSL
jgi:hypothetical protein